MIHIKGRKIDDYGQVIFTEDGLCKILLDGGSIENLKAESTIRIKQFNDLYKVWDNGDQCLVYYQLKSESLIEYHKQRQNAWFMPDEFKNVDVKKWLIEKCNTIEEIERVNLEYDLFLERGMIPLLLFLIFLVDYMTTKEIVWGVGRGSSVASYCLFLIGIHRINSMKFNLDIREFLK